MAKTEQSIAYSYLRFSTPEQAAGDSFRRQSEMAANYAEQHGLELAELTYKDLGVSGYRGKNAETGALRTFLDAVEAGDIKPGSILLVEALDRISRRTARKAVRVLEDIVEAGVDVVTLNDGKRYTVESLDGMDFIIAVLLLIRGHEESRTKGRRIRAAWQNKRNQAADKPLTILTPGWIRVEKTGDRKWSEPELILDRTEIVKRIFDEFLVGRGKEAIARGLNEDKVDTFGRAARWHKSYVQKILNNSAVVGVYVPHELRDGKRVPLDPVRDYYPKAIGVETWKRAQVLLKSSGKTKARNGAVRNILATLAKCPKCGATMTRVMKGNVKKGGKPKLVCTAAKSGARDFDGSQFCTYTSVPLDAVENALVRNAEVFARIVPARDANLQADIDGCDRELHITLTSLENLLDALSEKPSNAIENRVRKLEAKAEKLRAELDELKTKAGQTESQLVANRAERLNKALSTKPVDIAAANAALRECFSHVVVDYDDGDLRCKWRHTDQDLALVYDPGFAPLTAAD